MNIEIENKESSLRLHKLYASNINLSIGKDETEVIEDNIFDSNKNKYSVKCDVLSKNQYFIVVLSMVIATEDSTANLSVELTAVYTIESGDLSEEKKTNLLTQNAVSIMFPFLRAHISSLAHIINLGDINIPIFNIAAALAESRSHRKNIDATSEQANENKPDEH